MGEKAGAVENFRKKPSSLPVARLTRRPTVAFPKVSVDRIQEALLGTFKRFDFKAIDLEALIYFTLQGAFPELKLEEYEGMHKLMRMHVINNFAIHQTGALRLADVSMYRLVVCYTDDKDV